mgnify:CR=1 FL=1|tara:strand:+ start:353 stop:604 length:252 start_codon:yes stop_codon:yes gene_type:complete
MRRPANKPGSAHPAAVGLQHFLRSVPENKKSDALRELKRTSGMSKLAMLEHLGNRIKQSGKEPRPPSKEEIQAQERLNLLSMK